MNRVALGFRAHSGWAAVVAIALNGREPRVIHRGRIELVAPGAKGGVQPYHLARKMNSTDAAAFIRHVTDTTDNTTAEAVEELIADLKSKGHTVAACGIVLASGRPLPPLESTLRSHAMVHTAEGELFRGAIAHAAEKCGLRVSGVKERELYDCAAKTFHFSAAKLMRCLAEMGKALGTPWTSDEKNATLVAWLALAADDRP